MSDLFAMGIPYTADDRGYLLWLRDMWPGFVVPILCLIYVLVTAWLVRRSRAASAHGTASQAT